MEDAASPSPENGNHGELESNDRVHSSLASSPLSSPPSSSPFSCPRTPGPGSPPATPLVPRGIILNDPTPDVPAPHVDAPQSRPRIPGLPPIGTFSVTPEFAPFRSVESTRSDRRALSPLDFVVSDSVDEDIDLLSLGRTSRHSASDDEGIDLSSVGHPAQQSEDHEHSSSTPLTQARRDSSHGEPHSATSVNAVARLFEPNAPARSWAYQILEAQGQTLAPPERPLYPFEQDLRSRPNASGGHGLQGRVLAPAKTPQDSTPNVPAIIRRPRNTPRNVPFAPTPALAGPSRPLAAPPTPALPNEYVVPRANGGPNHPEDYTSFLPSERNLCECNLPEILGRLFVKSTKNLRIRPLNPVRISKVSGRTLRNVDIPERIFSYPEEVLLLFWMTKATVRDVVDRMVGYHHVDEDDKNKEKSVLKDGELSKHQMTKLTRRIGTRAMRARYRFGIPAPGLSPFIPRKQGVSKEDYKNEITDMTKNIMGKLRTSEQWLRNSAWAIRGGRMVLERPAGCQCPVCQEGWPEVSFEAGSEVALTKEMQEVFRQVRPGEQIPTPGNPVVTFISSPQQSPAPDELQLMPTTANTSRPPNSSINVTLAAHGGPSGGRRWIIDVPANHANTSQPTAQLVRVENASPAPNTTPKQMTYDLFWKKCGFTRPPTREYALGTSTTQQDIQRAEHVAQPNNADSSARNHSSNFLGKRKRSETRQSGTNHEASTSSALVLLPLQQQENIASVTGEGEHEAGDKSSQERPIKKAKTQDNKAEEATTNTGEALSNEGAEEQNHVAIDEDDVMEDQESKADG
ncbi:hypothetical protein EJ08DRAFT_703825 [Tothia fuscella]|uniref:Uncharacterized protein n=1 Tax=Tothia fuscella TaxID=1048955 RepID=A0A9P4TR97_9PEZI|nr:hypothetical protein EJ08DRAFT_703825 [Tothia fuscella]